jgi:uncharacterized protein (TIGR02001 family)
LISASPVQADIDCVPSAAAFAARQSGQRTLLSHQSLDYRAGAAVAKENQMTSYLRVPAAVLLSSILGFSLAQAQETQPLGDQPAWSVTGGASLVSQYLFRGVSQTQGKPTVQAYAEAAHASGGYAGIWASGVSNAAYNNGAGSEFDVYGGYRHDFGASHVADVALYTFWFPGADYTFNGKRIKYDSAELKLGYSKDSFNVTAWYTLSKRLVGLAFDPFTGAEVSTRGSTYLEVNWNPELAPNWTLNLHAGRQNVHDLSAYNFTDLRAGVTHTIGTWQVSLAVSHNNGDASRDGVPVWTFFDADGRGKNVVGTQWLASVTKSF